MTREDVTRVLNERLGTAAPVIIQSDYQSGYPEIMSLTWIPEKGTEVVLTYHTEWSYFKGEWNLKHIVYGTEKVLAIVATISS